MRTQTATPPTCTCTTATTGSEEMKGVEATGGYAQVSQPRQFAELAWDGPGEFIAKQNSAQPAHTFVQKCEGGTGSHYIYTSKQVVVIIDIFVIHGYIYETVSVVSVEIGIASVASSVLSSARSKVQLSSPMCYNYRRFDMPLPLPSDPLCGYVPPEWSS